MSDKEKKMRAAELTEASNVAWLKLTEAAPELLDNSCECCMRKAARIAFILGVKWQIERTLERSKT